MSNLNKEIEDALAEIDVPSDKELRRDTWAANVKAGATIRNDNKEWKDAIKKSAKKRYAGEEGKAEHARSMARRNENEQWKQANADAKRKLFSNIENHPRYAGPITGTSIKDGSKVVVRGSKDSESQGFDYASVQRVVSGFRKTYKGYTWKREEK